VPASTPDDSEGKPAQDFNSLRYIADALQNLEQTVESADARPTPDQYTAFNVLKTKAMRALAAIR
jgi:predicted KAP-like P-loop ATPase